MITRWLICSTLGMLLILTESASTMAQAGPPCGPDLPIKCTPGRNAAIVLGFVGAGALAIYLAYRIDHPRGQTSIAGCTASVNGTINLMDESTRTTYLLSPARKKVKAGERVILKGKKSQNAPGSNVFRVTKVVKDDGPCGAVQKDSK